MPEDKAVHINPEHLVKELTQRGMTERQARSDVGNTLRQLHEQLDRRGNAVIRTRTKQGREAFITVERDNSE